MEWTKLLNTRRENIHTHYTFSFHARVHIYSYGYVDIPRQITSGGMEVCSLQRTCHQSNPNQLLLLMCAFFDQSFLRKFSGIVKHT